jgi:ankyrin repeat protein
LLDHGWNPNEDLDGQGGTMLNYAAEGEEPAAIELLLSRGAVVNRRALETPTSVDALALLWDAARVRPASAQARALLWRAARDNRVGIIQWLLDKGVDVDAPQPGTGTTPLMIAAKSPGTENFDALLRHGARVGLRDASGNQLLWYAVEADHNSGRLARVLALGVQVDAVNNDERTALMHAAESCALMSIRALLAAGANPAHQDKSGKTARDLVPQGRGDYQAGLCGTVRGVLTR